MSKYDVATLLSSGSVGQIKKDPLKTDPFEREERAIFVWMYMSFFIEISAIYLKTCMICAWSELFLLEFNEIFNFCFDTFTYCDKDSFMSFLIDCLFCTN